MHKPICGRGYRYAEVHLSYLYSLMHAIAAGDEQTPGVKTRENEQREYAECVRFSTA